jgi:hypothetical protein
MRQQLQRWLPAQVAAEVDEQRCLVEPFEQLAGQISAASPAKPNASVAAQKVATFALVAMSAEQPPASTQSATDSCSTNSTSKPSSRSASAQLRRTQALPPWRCVLASAPATTIDRADIHVHTLRSGKTAEVRPSDAHGRTTGG